MGGELVLRFHRLPAKYVAFPEWNRPRHPESRTIHEHQHAFSPDCRPASRRVGARVVVGQPTTALVAGVVGAALGRPGASLVDSAARQPLLPIDGPEPG